jgi:mRNA-degrading endonuclease RelE of RelBE toxin-antitoxin system
MINKNYAVLFTDNFMNEFDKLPDNYQKLVLKKIELLAVDPRYPSLRTQKIGGVFESSVTMDIRIIWKVDIENNKIIVLLDLGHHDLLRKYN